MFFLSPMFVVSDIYRLNSLSLRDDSSSSNTVKLLVCPLPHVDLFDCGLAVEFAYVFMDFNVQLLGGFAEVGEFELIVFSTAKVCLRRMTDVD